MTRWFSMVVIMLAGLAMLTVAPDAAARVCSGSACLDMDLLRDPPPLQRGGTTTIAFTVTVRGAVDSATFEGFANDGLLVVADSAVLDGTVVSGARYVAHAVRLTLAGPGSALAPGTHTITFDVRAEESIGATGSAGATLGFEADGAPRRGVNVSTEVSVDGDDYGIDLQVPNGAPLLARPDSWISFPAQIEASGASGPAALGVTLPSGLGTAIRIYRLGSSGVQQRLGARLTCRATGAHSAGCLIPQDAANAPIEIFLPTRRDTHPGAAGTMQFEIAPSHGPDPRPQDNHAQAAVHFVAATDVSWTFSRSHVDAALGSSVDLTFTIANNGTTATPQLSGQFRFDPSLDEQNPPFGVRVTGPGLFGGGGSLPFHAGPLRPGASAVYHVTVQPATLGATLTLTVVDDTYSPTPDCFDAGCTATATASVTAVTPAPTGTGGLADTGSAARQQLLIAALLLSVGSALLVGGRRRLRHTPSSCRRL